MSHAKRYADADATTESLLLISKKLDRHGEAIGRLEEGQRRLEEGQGRLDDRQRRLEEGQGVLMDNQAELRRDVKDNTAMLSAIMAHLGIPKS